MNLGRKAPPLPPKRASARVQARANSPSATTLIDESNLSIEGPHAAKEGMESAFLLQQKQLHQKTNFQPTSTATTTTRVSGRIQERAASAAVKETSDESNLSIEGLDAEKEASKSVFLLQEKQLHQKTNFQPRSTATTTTTRVSTMIQERTASAAASSDSRLSNEEGLGAAKEARGSALLQQTRVVSTPRTRIFNQR